MDLPLYLQAICALAAVHSDSRLASAISMPLFATGVAASVLLIAAHDRPFIGQLSVTPEPLIQMMPEAQRS
jgi:predicted naringenin-chalcone synthase